MPLFGTDTILQGEGKVLQSQAEGELSGPNRMLRPITNVAVVLLANEQSHVFVRPCRRNEAFLARELGLRVLKIRTPVKATGSTESHRGLTTGEEGDKAVRAHPVQKHSLTPRAHCTSAGGRGWGQVSADRASEAGAGEEPAGSSGFRRAEAPGPALGEVG